MASIDVVDIRKAYCGHEVIHGVSVIAGLESITSGAIKIGNRVVDRLAPKDRDTAMVSQNYALYPHKTVAENMGFALKLRGAPKGEVESRVRRAAEILGVVPLLSRYPRQLSGG